MSNTERLATVSVAVLGLCTLVVSSRARADEVVTRFGEVAPVSADPDLLRCTIKSIKDFKGGATVMADEALVERPWSGRFAEQLVPYVMNVNVVGGELRLEKPPTAGMVTIFRDNAPALSVAFILAADGWNCAESLKAVKSEHR